MRALINTNTPLGFVLLEEIRPRLPIPLQSASYVRSHFLSSRIAFILLYTILGYLNLIFFFLNGFLRGHSLLNRFVLPTALGSLEVLC